MSNACLQPDGTIKSKGSQVFNVPNTEEGKAFIKKARAFLNNGAFKGIRSRGRGKRPSRRYHDSLPQGMSDWLAVYVDGANDCPQWAKERMAEWGKRINELKLIEDKLRKDVDELIERNAELERNNQAFADELTEARTDMGTTTINFCGRRLEIVNAKSIKVLS